MRTMRIKHRCRELVLRPCYANFDSARARTYECAVLANGACCPRWRWFARVFDLELRKFYNRLEWIEYCFSAYDDRTVYPRVPVLVSTLSMRMQLSPSIASLLVARVFLTQRQQDTLWHVPRHRLSQGFVFYAAYTANNKSGRRGL